MELIKYPINRTKSFFVEEEFHIEFLVEILRQGACDFSLKDIITEAIDFENEAVFLRVKDRLFETFLTKKEYECKIFKI